MNLTRLGAYDILSPLGAGGMGAVYRARDTRLGRDVAIKVLPPEFATDAERIARFQREAQVLAALNHPHIAQIYGFEDAGNTHALVMELVDGETLDKRLAHGALPVDEALPIAKQIADALEAAHEKGIIHRDLKPSNIALTSDGQVKVLDFGLAKLTRPAEAGPYDDRGVRLQPDLSASPTLTSPALMTGVGVLLGTAAYMSPEQAKGREADKRSDVWAFGCVLYEMLTGKRAFTGDDVADTLASVLKAEPDWTALPPVTPGVLRLLRWSLRRDRGARLADLSSARLELSEPSYEIAAPAVSRRAAWWPIIMAGVAAIFGAAIAWFLRPPMAVTPAVARLSIRLPARQQFATFRGGVIAVSPDGRSIVYVARDTTSARLFVRRLDRFEPTSLTTSDDAADAPFFSPDGQWVGFLKGQSEVWKVSAFGGEPVRVATVPGSGVVLGGAWCRDGTIVVATGTGLVRVSAAGGIPQPVALPEGTRLGARWPYALPNQDAVLVQDLYKGYIWRVQLDTGAAVATDRKGVPVAVLPGYLLYVRNRTLWAVAFDQRSGQTTGDERLLIDGIPETANGGAAIAISPDGLLLKPSLTSRIGGAQVERGDVVLIDRKGNPTAMGIPTGDYREPRFDPSGHRLAIADGAGDIWVYDIARGARVRLPKSNPDAIYTRPVWSVDGQRIAFRRVGTAGPSSADLYWAPADGSGSEEPLLEAEEQQWVDNWSPDGSVLAFTQARADAGRDIYLLRRGHAPIPFLVTKFSERNPRFSPDGRWIAYVSNESGRDEVYITPSNPGGAKTAVSVGGGNEVAWNPRGGELFYRNGTKLLRVAVRLAPSLEVGKPEVLFDQPLAHDGGPNTSDYDVRPDGGGFVFIKPAEDVENNEIAVVQHAFQEFAKVLAAQ